MPMELQGLLQDVHDDTEKALRVITQAGEGGGLTDTQLRATPVEVDITDAFITLDEPISVNVAAPTVPYHGQKVVATAGTGEALATSQAVLSVVVKALHANTGFIHVGASGVDNATSPGFVLDAGESVALDIDNLADVFLDATVNGEGVSYLAVG